MHMRHLLFFFSTRTGLASHSRKKTSIMKPAASSRAISSATILLFSFDSRRRGCLTGLASALTCSLCSAKSIGTPDMSLGDHAKMSRFSQRKSTSLLSYLLSRLVPTIACLSGCSGSKGIFFVSLVGWKDPWISDSLGYGDRSGCLLAMATTRSRSFFSEAITRDSASRLLAAAQVAYFS